jgi:hypothetical protein
MPAFTQDDVNIRITVRLSCSITLGAHGNPITREEIAEHVERLIADGGADHLIDGYTIEAVTLDDGTTIIENDPGIMV